MSWRRGRDSNPRYGCPYFAFRVRRDRPLCHLSGSRGALRRSPLLNGAPPGRKCPCTAVLKAHWAPGAPAPARYSSQGGTMFVVKHAAPSPTGHRTANQLVSNKFSRNGTFRTSWRREGRSQMLEKDTHDASRSALEHRALSHLSGVLLPREHTGRQRAGH